MKYIVILLIIFQIITFGIFSGCLNEKTTSAPTIHSFISQPNQIEEGGYAALIWNVTNADIVTIDNSIGNVELKGSRVVQPNDTTLYILTAKNSAGSSFAHTQIVVGFWAKPAESPKVLVKPLNSSKCIIITLVTGGINYPDDGYSFEDSVTIWLNGTVMDEINLSNNIGWELGENLYIGGSNPILEDEWLYVEELGSGYYLLTIRVNGTVIYDDDIKIN
jgi:hypothetical protein